MLDKKLFSSQKHKIFLGGLLSLLIYSSFILVEPIRTRLGDHALTLHNNQIYQLIILSLLLLLFVYSFCYKNISRDNIILVYSYFILFNLVLLFVWPISAVDVFNYISHSRILGHFGANPFLSVFSNFSQDTYFEFYKNVWSNMPSVYGPVFLISSLMVYYLSFGNVLINLFLFKLFIIAINLINCYLIYKITDSHKASFLYAWNPLILFELAVNSHNDALMILFFLVSLWSIKNSKYFLAVIFLALSFLTKFFVLIFFPFMLLYIYKQKKSFLNIFLYLLVFIVSIFIFYFYFWEGVQTLYPILHQASSFNHNLIFSSWGILFFYFTIHSFFSSNHSLVYSQLAGKILYCCIYAYWLIKAFRYKIFNFENLIGLLSLMLAAFFLLFFTWLVPWYFTLILTLLIISSRQKLKERTMLLLIYTITGYSILNYLILR